MPRIEAQKGRYCREKQFFISITISAFSLTDLAVFLWSDFFEVDYFGENIMDSKNSLSR